jgi:membrane-bound metal-dependent hydrolase YbcI (DUF457 family)
MPSPIGHALAGLALERLHASGAPTRGRAVLAAAAAVLPDLDLALRYVDGRNHHRAASHSLGAALLVGVLVWACRRVSGRPGALAWGSLAAAAWLSHVLLDWLGRDTNPPLGLMALWPLSDGWFQSPWPIFLDIGRTLDLHTIGSNALAAAWEVLLLAPLLWLAARSRRARQEHSRGSRL